MTDEILVVEDDRDLRPLLVHTFETEGFDVTAFEDGAEALEFLDAGNRPACILLDLVMPEVDGLDVLEVYAEDDELAAIPVIMMTGWDGDDAVETALNCGADDYITKPFSPTELVANVRTLIE